ncbi:hypothetical protein GCM10011521_17960 [Arenimonas soli]|uniref:HEAT repeat domain-containing protein n=2 Tax=Arenimonas soli TaxID=2269504 RepID=A0ABQ1HKC1_9GAMM|nr:hypothetical protein GCM10011521_17960 [Arenimonas soli]
MQMGVLGTLLGLCLPSAILAAPGVSPCDDLAGCEAQLREAAATYKEGKVGGVPDGHFAIAETFAALEGGVPRLVALLSHPDKRVAELAAIGLRRADFIDERHLPALVDGLDRDLGWLAPALAAVPGERAADEAVARYLVSDSAPENQEGYAIERLGARAVPALLRAARCSQGCDRDTRYRLIGIFGNAGDVLSDAAPTLLEMAGDPSMPGDAASLQLALIAEIGSAAPSIEEGLLAIRESKPELRWEADTALVGIGSRASGRILAERLQDGPDERVLRDIAQVGEAARDAAPALVGLIPHEDSRARILAVSALGEVGGDVAIAALIAALRDERDLRLPWVAARALGRLRAQAGREALIELSTTHSFPVIRNVAAQSLKQLESPGETPEEDEAFESMGLFAFEYPGLDLGVCDRPDARKVKPARGSKLTYEWHEKQLESLAYDAVVLSYGAGDEDEQRAKDPEAIIEVHPGNMVEHRTPVREVPHVALRVEDGWIVGSNRGEWGGEIAFVPDIGKPRIFLSQNVVDLHRLGDQVVAVTGIAHLFLNEGEVFRIQRDASGDWEAKAWRTLPGAPRDSWITRDGALWIDVVDGSLLLTPAGRMIAPPCRD